MRSWSPVGTLVLSLGLAFAFAKAPQTKDKSPEFFLK